MNLTQSNGTSWEGKEKKLFVGSGSLGVTLGKPVVPLTIREVGELAAGEWIHFSSQAFEL